MTCPGTLPGPKLVLPAHQASLTATTTLIQPTFSSHLAPVAAPHQSPCLLCAHPLSPILYTAGSVILLKMPELLCTPQFIHPFSRALLSASHVPGTV